MVKREQTQTSYIRYLGVSVTLHKDGVAHADYPNDPQIVREIKRQLSEKQRALKSDRTRYRVYFCKNSMAKIFEGIESIMQLSPQTA